MVEHAGEPGGHAFNGSARLLFWGRGSSIALATAVMPFELSAIRLHSRQFDQLYLSSPII